MAQPPPGKDLVAIIMTIGLATALNLITLGVLFNAFYRGRSGGDPSLSENATQLLATSFGGMIGVIGSYMGYRAGVAANKTPPAPPTESEDEET